MRCLSCNKALNDFEATKKYADVEPVVFLELCSRCEKLSEFPDGTIEERADLQGKRYE